MSSLRDSDFFEEEEEEEVLPSPPEGPQHPLPSQHRPLKLTVPANTTTSAPTPTDDDDDDDDDMDWERASRTPAYITETYDLSDSDLARELDAFYGVDAAVQSSEAEGYVCERGPPRRALKTQIADNGSSRVDEEKEEGEGEDEEEEEEEELEEVMLVMTREEYVQEALNVLTNS